MCVTLVRGLFASAEGFSMLKTTDKEKYVNNVK